MNPLEEIDEHCPYCGEKIQLLIDITETQGAYVEDCQVCCRPMIIELQSDNTLVINREDDA